MKELRERIINAFNNVHPDSELNQEELMVLYNIMVSSDAELNVVIDDLDVTTEIYEHFKPLIKSFPAQILLKRLEAFSTIKLTLGALISILLRADTPGAVVMYGFYIHNKLEPDTVVTKELFSTKLFPWGYFSEKQLKELWDIQKLTKEERVLEIMNNGLDLKHIWTK